MVTHSVHSTLNSIGGIQVLFPLFAQLDLPSSEPSLGSSTESSENENQEDKSVQATTTTAGAPASGPKDQSRW